MTQPHILLLGGHGNVSMKMIPLFLGKQWNVTAMIRDSTKLDDQRREILHLRTQVKNPGALDVIVHSLEDIKTSQDAENVINKVKGVNWIVWSAGAGGKGNTNAIDRDAAVAFAHAATHSNQIERYLTISAINSRRHVAPWWDDKEAKAMKAAGDGIKTYTLAKTVADECLTTWAEERRAKDKTFKYIVLRPGALDGKEPTKDEGKIQLGRTNGGKQIRRNDVALTAAELLDQGANGWFDLMEGDTEIKKAVADVVSQGEEATSLERGELKEMRETADKAFTKAWEEYCDAEHFEANQLPKN